ncbi:nucleophile aminohydrolase [Mycena pura]|uniref:Nucleophile aminohydrolase n=1 Tax=Mycena pura TaxID=153505 RepID=A0AAD7E5H7_9AGAR|nr:nucleophile aminohydrolase [Mycena pura]
MCLLMLMSVCLWTGSFVKYILTSVSGLGHVRLAIIDLPSGQQPLSDEDELIHCVVTGEIYDHERIRAEMQSQGYLFKSMSDSELVVQLYKRDGFNLLPNLRGEFAFVLYDLKRRLLFVARDRFGIKPLYYTVYNGCIMFSSEMKAFMGLGWQAEWDVESIVQNGEFNDERTVFRGVQKLPAGYYAICRASGQIQTEAYWDFNYPPATSPPPATLDTMILKVRELLVEAVRLRLRSDVPLAVYLSGGIDSSSVAGNATHLLREKDPNAKLTTFTLAYIGMKTENSVMTRL